MKQDNIRKAVELEKKTGHVFVVTSDRSGVPHIAIARDLTVISTGRVSVTSWFCMGTLGNIQVNPKVVLAVWDDATDGGYQLIGEIENVGEIAMMDGFVPGERRVVPQIERRFQVRVESMIALTRTAHEDKPI